MQESSEETSSVGNDNEACKNPRTILATNPPEGRSRSFQTDLLPSHSTAVEERDRGQQNWLILHARR